MNREFLDSLTAEREKLQRQIEADAIALQKLRVQIDESRKLAEALDVVIRTFSSNAKGFIVNVTAEGASAEYGRATKFFGGEVEDRDSDSKFNVRATARKHFDELPSAYTKKDVEALILKYAPTNFGPLKDNSLRSVVLQFVQLGWANVGKAATGRALQVYEKVLR